MNAATSREVRSLRAQVEELKTMMRLSFDMQLDIQRAIRQEVAAAMVNASGKQSSSNVKICFKGEYMKYTCITKIAMRNI